MKWTLDEQLAAPRHERGAAARDALGRLSTAKRAASNRGGDSSKQQRRDDDPDRPAHAPAQSGNNAKSCQQGDKARLRERDQQPTEENHCRQPAECDLLVAFLPADPGDQQDDHNDEEAAEDVGVEEHRIDAEVVGELV